MNRSLILWGLGVSEHLDGSYAVSAIANLAMLTRNNFVQHTLYEVIRYQQSSRVKIILDAQLPPKLTEWIAYKFDIETIHVRELSLQNAKDREIYDFAKKENAILMTKDRDFLEFYFRFGAPPKVILLNCGNSTNKFLIDFLKDTLPKAMKILENEDIVEIG